jgi:putative membrane protein
MALAVVGAFVSECVVLLCKQKRAVPAAEQPF